MANESERKMLVDAQIRRFIKENLCILIHAEPDFLTNDMTKVKVELLLRSADSFRLDEVDVIDTDFVYIQTGE
jgi:hypothetical protein